MLQTPLHSWHVAHGGRMVDFAGWAMPVQYSTIVEEHQAVRTDVGLFDISHMGRLRLTGRDAVRFVERLVTCRVADLKLSQVRYGLVTNSSGGILDDILVYRLGDEEIGLVVNASNREKIVAWIEQQHADSEVILRDETIETGMLALQGPSAMELLSPHVDINLSQLRYYRCANATVLDFRVVVSRTGYTGEDGFEFILPAEQTEPLWERLLGLGDGRVVPCGLGCRDTLRLEAGMPLYGHELTEEIDPVTAGLSFAVALEKDFIGRDAIAKIADRGPKQARVGLELSGKRIAREGTPVFTAGDRIGEVTSGTFSPTLQKSIAMAYVDAGGAQPGRELEVDLRGKREPAMIVPLPFYRRANRG